MLSAQVKQREKENKELINKNRAKLKQELQKNKAATKLYEHMNKLKENIRKNEMSKFEEPFKPKHKSKTKGSSKRK